MRHEIRLALLSAALPVAVAAQPPAAADSGAFLKREIAAGAAARTDHSRRVREYASVTPPVKRLRRFAKVVLGTGETRSVRFEVAREDFSFVGADGKWTFEPGAFTVALGGLKQDLTLER